MKKRIIFTLILVIVPLLIWVNYYMNYNLDRLKPEAEEILVEKISPDNKYKVTVGLSSYNATTPWNIRGVATNLSNNEERVIYWNKGETATLEWVDNRTVVINGKEIDVVEGSYDYRHDD
jgi:Tol biopolymer transport system component